MFFVEQKILAAGQAVQLPPPLFLFLPLHVLHDLWPYVCYHCREECSSSWVCARCSAEILSCLCPHQQSPLHHTTVLSAQCHWSCNIAWLHSTAANLSAEPPPLTTASLLPHHNLNLEASQCTDANLAAPCLRQRRHFVISSIEIPQLPSDFGMGEKGLCSNQSNFLLVFNVGKRRKESISTLKIALFHGNEFFFQDKQGIRVCLLGRKVRRGEINIKLHMELMILYIFCVTFPPPLVSSSK